MLSAAAKEPKIKRVVITSTCLVMEPKNGADKAGRKFMYHVQGRERQADQIQHMI